jgi:DNA polymerase elongation subunit (family B)
MLEQYKNDDILFLDIETVPQEKSFDDINETMQALWDKKSKYFRKDDETPADVYQRAGIYAEFGKIVCISIGGIQMEEDGKTFWSHSFAGSDEKQLLEDFAAILNKPKNKRKYLCGHNIKEFDVPFIARRMLINGIKLPDSLNIAGKKPWEVNFIDTLDLWKFGDYKHYTSLNLLTNIFGIPSPKDDIDGSEVARVFYEENDIERIAVYCEKDVLATAQLFLRFKGESLIDPANVESV